MEACDGAEDAGMRVGEGAPDGTCDAVEEREWNSYE